MRINLSAQSINSTAPYAVRSDNGRFFTFYTRLGQLYEVGFVEDNMLSDDGMIYQFFITNRDGPPHTLDINIHKTIVAILEEFFRMTNMSIVYICDTHDGRQAARQRLFKMWFNSYPRKNLYRLVSRELIVDNIPYYVNLLARKDMPSLQSRIEALDSLYQTLLEK